MAVTVLWTFLWTLSCGSIVGMSQAPVLTETIISPWICASETEVYICNSTSTLVQWIAEPFVTTRSPVAISTGSNFGGAVFQDGDIVIEQISRDPDPFVTSLSVSGRVLEIVRVRCINAIGNISSLKEFTSNAGASVQSSTCNTVDIMSTNFSAGMAALRVGCQPSVSPEVTHTLNYTGGSIMFDGTEARIDVSCDVGSLELRVCVSNRCGQETCGETETFPITCPDSPTSPASMVCPSCVWCYAVLGIVSLLSVGGVTGVTVTVGYVKYFKKGENEKERSIRLEATDNDAVNKA